MAVIVAAHDIDLGAELRREDLRAIQWPADAVPMGAFASPTSWSGRGLIQPVAQNEPFLPAKLASKEAGAGLPPIIPEGYPRPVGAGERRRRRRRLRAARHARRRAWPRSTRHSSPRTCTSKVILTNVQVLAAGTKIERDEADGKPIAVSVVTLLVDPGAGRDA